MLFHLSSLTGTFGAFESFQIKVFLWVDFNVGAENRKWELSHKPYVYRVPQKVALGMPSFQKSAVFLNIVQKAFDPPPLLFEHLPYFAGGVF